MKTPQQVFSLMLGIWDKQYLDYNDGICLRLSNMAYYLKTINTQEKDHAEEFLDRNREVAIDKFGAKSAKESAFEEGDYWWEPGNQEIRKQFVEYLSKLNNEENN